MAKQMKGRIRHVALSVQDPWETAEFYKEALGLEEVTELDGALAEGVFLTDGVVNLALLKFKTDAASQGTGRISLASTILASGWTTLSNRARSYAILAPNGSWATQTIPMATRSNTPTSLGSFSTLLPMAGRGHRRTLGKRTTSCTRILSGASPNSMSAARQLARTSRRAKRSRRLRLSERPTRPDGGSVARRCRDQWRRAS